MSWCDLIWYWWYWWLFLLLDKIISKWFQVIGMLVGIRGRTQSARTRGTASVVLSAAVMGPTYKYFRLRSNFPLYVKCTFQGHKSYMWLSQATLYIWRDLDFLLPLREWRVSLLVWVPVGMWSRLLWRVLWHGHLAFPAPVSWTVRRQWERPKRGPVLPAWHLLVTAFNTVAISPLPHI